MKIYEKIVKEWKPPVSLPENVSESVSETKETKEEPKEKINEKFSLITQFVLTFFEKIKKICDKKDEISKSFMNDVFDCFKKSDYGLNSTTLKKIIFTILYKNFKYLLLFILIINFSIITIKINTLLFILYILVLYIYFFNLQIYLSFKLYFYDLFCLKYLFLCLH